MIRIGLVGKIASGKTFIGKHIGFPIFNADAEVEKIYRTNKKCFYKLNKKFPKKIKSFPIIKSEISKVLNKKNIKILSKIVHPYVRTRLNKFLRKNKSKKYVVLDIPLLIENKLNRKTDILIYIKTLNSVILKRLKKRKNYNMKVLNLLRSQQLDISKKMILCNYIIDNSSSKKKTLKQVKKIKNKIK